MLWTMDGYRPNMTSLGYLGCVTVENFIVCAPVRLLNWRPFQFRTLFFNRVRKNKAFRLSPVQNFIVYVHQLRRILENSLYFLEVKAGRKTLHKIGITKRSIEERVIEVERDLLAHWKRVEIKILDTWQHRGNVELYFKHRYQSFNYRIGKLTEYFKFDEVGSVLSELRQMKPKALTPVEADILAGKLG